MATAPALDGWPDAYVELVDAGLPVSLLDSLRADADAIAAAPNFWLPRERLEAAPPERLPAAEAAVRHLLREHMAARLPAGGWTGAEFWVQVYAPGRGLAFHFDKDEVALAEDGTMRHPLTSSVLYLTGGSAAGARRQGATVVVEQLYDAARRAPAPDPPSRCALALPRAGHYLAFDGRLGHGVLDSFDSTAVRATLLVNWWDGARPRAVRELAAGDAEARGLTAVDAAAALAGRRGAALPLFSVEVPPGDHDTLLVDDLLSAAGVPLTGPRAAHLVALRHAGMVLCPVSPEGADGDGGGADGGEAPALQVAAMLVSEALMSSSSGGDDGSSSSSGGGSEGGGGEGGGGEGGGGEGGGGEGSRGGAEG